MKWYKSGFIYLLVLVAIAVLFFNVFTPSQSSTPLVSINQVLADAQDGMIKRIETQGGGGDLLVTYKDRSIGQVHSRLERGDSITRLLLDAGVPLDSIDIVVSQPAQTSDVLVVLSGLLPTIFIGALLFFFYRQARSGNQTVQNLAKHTWQVEAKPTGTFSDIGGMQGAKQAVADVIAYLKDPKRFGDMGDRMPRAILVQGPPGAGKGLFVRAVAGEAGVKLLSSHSAEFIEVFCGIAAARVRDLFQQAKKMAPVVVFIDELDAVGRGRMPLDKQASASEQQLLLSQLFVELDQLKAKRGVVLFAATNRPDLVDPALLRAGRFEKQIDLGLPTQDERLEILKVLLRDKSTAEALWLEVIAKRTQGYTGADLAAVVNQASLLALKGEHPISSEDLQQAIEMTKRLAETTRPAA